jgi:hypothetical protein
MNLQQPCVKCQKVVSVESEEGVVCDEKGRPFCSDCVNNTIAELAEERYASDEINIDRGSCVPSEAPVACSFGEEGAWVRAWVFVPKDVIEEQIPYPL